MTFPSPFISKNGNTQHHNNLPSPMIDQVYPTFGSMVQQQTALNLIPASSTSTYNRQVYLSLPSPPPLVAEDLEDNRFYVYLRSQFNTIFTSHSVVCIPHSSYLEDHHLTKAFIETHCFNASPYYRGQYQTNNGKVISIEMPEIPLLSTVSGFKERRTIRIMLDDWVYVGKKKIRVFMIQGLLEGEALDYQKSRNKISFPTCRNSKIDLMFLKSFGENIMPLIELQSDVKKFVGTYVYIRGFSSYTVEMIQHIYTKAYTTILQRNKVLRDACRTQAEYEHFLELVENVVMGLLHEKIWIQSLRSNLQSEDNRIRFICERYSKNNITLQQYVIKGMISEMPLSCFDKAISCLRRSDSNFDTPAYSTNSMNNTTLANSSSSIEPAFTPLEKIMCIKSTMDLISAAVDNYAKESRNGSNQDGFYVTTDEMIPLLAYVIAHSRLSRMASLIFYVEHFRLSHMEQPEHGFALATIRAAVSFLENDTLSLMKSSSATPTILTNSTSLTSLSVQVKGIRSKSTPSTSPLAPPTLSLSHATMLYSQYPTAKQHQSACHKQTQSLKPTYALPSSSTPSTSSSNIKSSNFQPSTGEPIQRKSQSANPPFISNEPKQSPQRQQKQQQQQQSCPSFSSTSSSSSSDSCKEEDYISMINPTSYHRHTHTHTPKTCSEIYVQSANETQPNADLLYDWILNNDDPNKSFSDAITTTIGTPHQKQYQPHYFQQTMPPRNILEDTQPMISATIPTISNSTPLPGNGSPPASSVLATIDQRSSNECHETSLKHKDRALAVATRSEITSTTRDHRNIAPKPTTASTATTATTTSTRTTTFSPATSWQFTLPPLHSLQPRLDNMNKKLDQSLSPSSVTVAVAANKTPHSSPKSTPATPGQPFSITTTNTTTTTIITTTANPPKVINITNRLSFDSSVLGRRPATLCLDRRSSSSSSIGRTRDLDSSQEDLGEFLLGLQKMDGNIIGESSGQVFRM